MFFSCSQNKPQEILIDLPRENTPLTSEFKYGINLDSFSYETHKIKWGQNFSDILTNRGISHKEVFDANLAIKPLFNLNIINFFFSEKLF